SCSTRPTRCPGPRPRPPHRSRPAPPADPRADSPASARSGPTARGSGRRGTSAGYVQPTGTAVQRQVCPGDRVIVTIYVVETPGGTPPPAGSRPAPTPIHLRWEVVPMAVSGIDLGKYKLGWSDREQYVYKPKKGLNEDVVRDISHQK